MSKFIIAGIIPLFKAKAAAPPRPLFLITFISCEYFRIRCLSFYRVIQSVPLPAAHFPSLRCQSFRFPSRCFPIRCRPTHCFRYPHCLNHRLNRCFHCHCCSRFRYPYLSFHCRCLIRCSHFPRFRACCFRAYCRPDCCFPRRCSDRRYCFRTNRRR